MRRRDFLVDISRAALAPFLSRTVTKSGDAWETLVADLEGKIPKMMEEASVPGLSIAIIKDAKLRWRKGFGVKDRDSKELVSEDTMFEAASMSKPVFAYAVMKLCERGVIDLDTPLTKYTSERFLEGDPRLELITARHVLSHTSGFQNWRSKKEPLAIHFTPGEKHLYSGEGYNYLQSVVSHVTGQPIEPYVKANLFVPFGMSSSGYVWTDSFARLMARPHDPDGRPLDNRKSTVTDVSRYGSAGALLTTPTDYTRFLIEVIEPKAGDAFRLTKGGIEEMLRPQVRVTANDEYSISWGLGWRIAKTRNGDFIGHGGDNPGFHSICEASVQRKAGYVIMTNGDNGQALINKLAPLVSARLYALSGG
jgi:CubicO group peptidase (beta-lactamase class C family)